jgi:hypothetical protein
MNRRKTIDALVSVVETVSLTETDYVHDHNYESGCTDSEMTRARDAGQVAIEIYTELERAGWSLVKVDPFAPAVDNPTAPPVVTVLAVDIKQGWAAADEALTAALDAFQEAAGQYTYDRTEGSSQEERESYQAMINARIALVRLVIGERTNAPAIGGAVLDAMTERLTRIEDWLDIYDPGWRGV